MRLMYIPADAVGRWDIETFASTTYVLDVPPDARATISRVPDPSDSDHDAPPSRTMRRDQEPLILIGWGHWDQMAGLQPGIVVGSCMLLLLEPLSHGAATARLSTPVVSIFEA